jgi:hypothetical protein
MSATARRTIMAAGVVAALAAQTAQAAIIRASADLGTVDAEAHTIGGIGEQVWGFRFVLDDVVRVEQVGVRLFGDPQREIFAAIVPLSGPASMPSLPFEETALASAVFNVPTNGPSADLRIPMPIILNPGGYALLFGSELGFAYLPYNNPPLVDPESIILTRSDLDGWRTTTSPAPYGLPRFVVEGVVIPEPSVGVLVAAAIACLGMQACQARPLGAGLKGAIS